MPRLTIQQRRDRDAAREAEKKAFGLDGDQEENNRVSEFLSELNNQTNDPEEMMLEIMDALNDTVTPIPDVGNFYTFVYNAKTPGEQYDQHPLIACTSLERWGFRDLTFIGKNTEIIHGVNWQDNCILYDQMNLMTF